MMPPFVRPRSLLYGGRPGLATCFGIDHKEFQNVLTRIAFAALLLVSSIAPAAAQIRIGLMVSATGPTSAIGIPQKNTGDILPRSIGGATVEYISLEDGGDATRAVQNAKKLIAENNVDAVIGPSTTPNAFGPTSCFSSRSWRAAPRTRPTTRRGCC